MGGKVSAEYYRKYRASHPSYRKREAERDRRRRHKGRGDRTKEYQRQAERRRERRLHETAEHGWLVESSLIRKARELATAKRKPDRRTVVWDDTHEELVGVATLALCEGTDPGEAMNDFLKAKRQWDHFRADLLYEGVLI